jgi:sigma-B regulation protein RsbU (phosphoserine phosphatase)
VSAFVGRLDLATGELAYANAGHNLPYRLSAGGAVSVLPASSGLVLALAEDFVFRAESVRLEPGDAVFFYTDGVTEAIDAGNVLFSEARLEAFLATAAGRPASEVVAGAIAAVDAFAGGAPQFDDITALAVRWRAG